MKDPKEQKETLTFRAPSAVIAKIGDDAKRLKVTESDILRRAVEKGYRAALSEIQDEQLKAARELVKNLKGKPAFDLPFNYGHTLLSVEGLPL